MGVLPFGIISLFGCGSSISIAVACKHIHKYIHMCVYARIVLLMGSRRGAEISVKCSSGLALDLKFRREIRAQSAAAAARKEGV